MLRIASNKDYEDLLSYEYHYSLKQNKMIFTYNDTILQFRIGKDYFYRKIGERSRYSIDIIAFTHFSWWIYQYIAHYKLLFKLISSEPLDGFVKIGEYYWSEKDYMNITMNYEDITQFEEVADI